MGVPVYYDIVCGAEKLELEDCVNQYQQSKSDYLLRVILYKLRGTIDYYLHIKTNYADKSELTALYEDKLLECLSKYDTSRGIKFVTYYSRCLDNALINFINSASREAALSLDYLVNDNLSLLDRLGDDGICLDELETQLLLSKLKGVLDYNEYRVCEVILNESYELKYIEIARELGLTLSAIPNILKRLRKKFNSGIFAELV